MKKFLSILLVAVVAVTFSGVSYAENIFVNGTANGQYTDINVTGADSTKTKRSGLKAIIDLGSAAQTSATATTTPVLALSQTATIAPVFGITCTNGGGVGGSNTNTCSSYTSTSGSKVGAIKINVNGADRYITFTSRPD